MEMNDYDKPLPNAGDQVEFDLAGRLHTATWTRFQDVKAGQLLVKGPVEFGWWMDHNKVVTVRRSEHCGYDNDWRLVTSDLPVDSDGAEGSATRALALVVDQLAVAC